MTAIILHDLMNEITEKPEKFDPAAVAELLGYLFEHNGKTRYNLWEVTNELFNISMTPLEAENPFPPYQPDSTQSLSEPVREEN